MKQWKINQLILAMALGITLSGIAVAEELLRADFSEPSFSADREAPARVPSTAAHAAGPEISPPFSEWHQS